MLEDTWAGGNASVLFFFFLQWHRSVRVLLVLTDLKTPVKTSLTVEILPLAAS